MRDFDLVNMVTGGGLVGLLCLSFMWMKWKKKQKHVQAMDVKEEQHGSMKLVKESFELMEKNGEILKSQIQELTAETKRLLGRLSTMSAKVTEYRGQIDEHTEYIRDLRIELGKKDVEIETQKKEISLLNKIIDEIRPC